MGSRVVSAPGAPPAGPSTSLPGVTPESDLLVEQLRDALAELGVAASSKSRLHAHELTPESATSEFAVALSARGLSPNTVRMYVWAVRKFLESARKPLDEISVLDIDRFRSQVRRGRRSSPQTVNLVTHALKAFFQSLGLTTARSLAAPRRPHPLPDYLREDQVRTVLSAADRDPRESAILHVLAYCGVRVSELCNLAVDDIDLNQGTLRVRCGKGNKDRYVVLDPSAAAALRAYLGTGVEGLLFPLSVTTVQRIVRAAGERAGLGRRVHPHILRHSLATALLRRGCDIRYIQTLLGHASVATTQIYAHVDLSDLRAAYTRARPEFALEGSAGV